MEAANFLQNYITLKQKTQGYRKSGLLTSKTDLLILNEDFKRLERSLKVIQGAPMEYEICSSEIARRTLILDNLRRSIASVRTEAGKLTSSSSPYSPPSVVDAFTSNSQYTSNPMIHMTDAGLIERQKMEMKNQDMMILNIEKGVDRLHHKAVTIGEEAKVHNRVMDDLDEHVDIATQGLREEAKHAEEIREKGKVCYMYMCVLVEVVVLCIIIAVLLLKPGS